MKIILMLLILSEVCYADEIEIICANGDLYSQKNDKCISSYSGRIYDGMIVNKNPIKFPKYKCDKIKICIKYDIDPKGTINADMKICSEYELESGMICEPIDT